MNKSINNIDEFMEEIWYPALEKYGRQKGVEAPLREDYKSGSGTQYMNAVQDYAIKLYRVALPDKEFIKSVTDPAGVIYKIENGVIYFKFK